MTLTDQLRKARTRKSVFLCFLLSAATLVRAQSTVDSNSASDLANPSPVASKTTAGVSVSSSGLVFSTADGATTLRVHGYTQADDRMFSSNIHGEGLDTFLFRRIRPLFEGTLFKAVDYRFMPDFGQSNPQIQEAYLEWKTFPFAKLRAGKFKEPIGLEVLRSDRELTFAERSLASDLVPLRYMGLQVGGSVLSDSIAYAAGYFNGSSDGSNGSFEWAPDNEFAGRVFCHPFAKTAVAAVRQFGVGLGGSLANQHGNIPGLKTVGQTEFFKYASGTVANGQHSRISPQAYYFVGPVGVMAEYVLSSQNVLNENATHTLNNAAWGITASVMLTGERNGYVGVRPHNSFRPTRGFRHIGAVELAARHSEVRIDSAAFPLFAQPATAPQKAEENGIGMNWYLNRFVTLTTDYEHTTFTMAPASAAPLHSEDVLMSRIQLAF